jgi:hypothetical protein
MLVIGVRIKIKNSNKNNLIFNKDVNGVFFAIYVLVKTATSLSCLSRGDVVHLPGRGREAPLYRLERGNVMKLYERRAPPQV